MTASDAQAAPSFNQGGYIHTFTPEEQQRLVDQALFLEPYHHALVDFGAAQSILEVGCGVGAQMSVLLRRWPRAHLTGVEPSSTQVARARTLLAPAISAGRASLHQAPGDALPFADQSFDAACVYWVFEHVPDPLPILGEVLRVLKPGGVFYATEVFDKALSLYPPCPETMRYFGAFMALQAEFGGDPNIGIRVPGLLAQAGFERIGITDVSPTLDARMTVPADRAAFLAYFENLLLSGAGPLIERGRIAPSQIEAVKRDFATLKADPAAVFSYGAKQIQGFKPV
ncbi:MAG: methyltransferase domain-containing protein [Rhodospirillaceae bacterium]|nr:methyltransferase domain-containing protein [Rhodospirillaceae bacterium]